MWWMMHRPLIAGSSQWRYDGAGFIEQVANIYGGPAGASSTSPDRPGTYLLHKENTGWVNSRDVCVRTNLQSMDNDGIGLLFRYLDEDNFYYFLMDSQRGVIRLGKKVAGTFAELAQPAVNTSMAPYTPGTIYQVAVAVVHDTVAVAIDGPGGY